MCANSIADWFCPCQGCLYTYASTLYKAAYARSYDSVVRFLRAWCVSNDFNRMLELNSSMSSDCSPDEI